MTKRRRSKKTGRFIRSRHHRTSTKRRTRGRRRTETWKGKRVRVTRNKRGRFVTWRKVRRYTRGKTAKQKWGTTARERKWKARTGRGKRIGGSHIAVYGSAHGKNKRIQMGGSPQQLYRAMQLAVKHPPKKQFLTISPEALLNDPEKYFELREYWDARPNIES